MTNTSLTYDQLFLGSDAGGQINSNGPTPAPGTFFTYADGPLTVGTTVTLTVGGNSGPTTYLGEYVFSQNGQPDQYLPVIGNPGDLGEVLAPTGVTGLNFPYDAVTFQGDVACYRSGTRIATPDGERAVEDLAAGDLVLTASGAVQSVRWTGRRALRLSNPRSRHQPVRIQAHAFGEGLPRRDLWVSPGHRLFVNDALIQAVMLVNGTSITRETVRDVTYWHVELDHHDILLAEGLPAESYQDAGNRSAFTGHDGVVALDPQLDSDRDAGVCAPILRDGEALDAVRALLRERAEALGFAVTADAGLHVMADGARIEPMWLNKSRAAFVLPQGAAAISLASRSFVPAMSEPGARDRRTLGVCVSGLQVDGEQVALDRLAGGWQSVEAGGTRRWTDGDGALPLGARIVIVDLGCRGWYIQRAPGIHEIRAAG